MIQGIKSILVVLTREFGPEESSSVVGCGLSLARAAGAHLDVEAAAQRIHLMSSWVTRYAADLVGAENARLQGLVRAATDGARTDAAAAGVSASTRATQLDPPGLLRHVTAVARVHDLVLVDAEPEPIHPDRQLLRSLLLEGGRPLIVVPAGCTDVRARRVLVAWDGSAPAARAVHDALPFLRAAETVRIVAVTGEKALPAEPGGADLATHLARHGVRADAEVRTARDGDVARSLREAAEEGSADLIVMGGYVRSPLRELVFGGVTHSLLGRCPVPLLMAH